MHIGLFAAVGGLYHARQSDPRNDFAFILYNEVGGRPAGADTDDSIEQPATAAFREETRRQLPQPEAPSGSGAPSSPEPDAMPEPRAEPQPPVPEPELAMEREREDFLPEKSEVRTTEDRPTPLVERKPEHEIQSLDAPTPVARRVPKRAQRDDATPPISEPLFETKPPLQAKRIDINIHAPEMPMEKPVDTPDPDKPEIALPEDRPARLDTPRPDDDDPLLADAGPAPKPRHRRTQRADPSPPPAPPPSVLILPGIPIAGSTGSLGGGGLGDGQGGVGDGPETGNPELLHTYASQIQRRLDQFKSYPRDARRGNVEGMAMVVFTVDSYGQVQHTTVLASSGNHALDEEALSLPGRAAPFPPIPEGLRLQSVRLTVPIQFSLR